MVIGTVSVMEYDLIAAEETKRRYAVMREIYDRGSQILTKMYDIGMSVEDILFVKEVIYLRCLELAEQDMHGPMC